MNNHNTIGDYSITKTLRSTTNGTVIFEVIKDTTSPQLRYHAEVHQLNTKIDLKTLVWKMRKEAGNYAV
jgi:hypothetical protein